MPQEIDAPRQVHCRVSDPPPEEPAPGEPLPPPVGTLAELSEPAPTSGSNYLQVGAYSDPVNANALLKQIHKLGLKNAEVRQGVFHGGPIHRVIVGPFADEAKLKAAVLLEVLGVR